LSPCSQCVCLDVLFILRKTCSFHSFFPPFFFYALNRWPLFVPFFNMFGFSILCHGHRFSRLYPPVFLAPLSSFPPCERIPSFPVFTGSFAPPICLPLSVFPFEDGDTRARGFWAVPFSSFLRPTKHLTFFLSIPHQPGSRSFRPVPFPCLDQKPNNAPLPPPLFFPPRPLPPRQEQIPPPAGCPDFPLPPIPLKVGFQRPDGVLSPSVSPVFSPLSSPGRIAFPSTC